MPMWELAKIGSQNYRLSEMHFLKQGRHAKVGGGRVINRLSNLPLAPTPLKGSSFLKIFRKFFFPKISAQKICPQTRFK